MNPLQTRRLGNTAAELPILGFGGAPLGELFEKVDEAQSTETLDTALFRRNPILRHGTLLWTRAQ